MNAMNKQDGATNFIPVKIVNVRSWRAVLRRAVAWKTARYTKGDIEATVVGITDADGVTGYGYMPAMLIVGESPATAEALLHGTVAPLLQCNDHRGIQQVMRQIDIAIGGNFQLKFAVEEALFD
jgi:L-alanine-DL-glutamate epimerase-like enolase superfamily enzyme